jgi:hypothetical protein
MHNRYTNQPLPGARQQFEQEAHLLLRTHPGYLMMILEGMDQSKLHRLRASADLEKELEVLRSLNKCLIPKEVCSEKFIQFIDVHTYIHAYTPPANRQ